MKYLRLNAQEVRQNITYNCHNSHAHRSEDGQIQTYMQILTSKKHILTTSSDQRKRRIRNLYDGCDKKKDKWDKAVFSFATAETNLLPIKDVSVRGSQDGYFKILVGPVCFT